MTTTSALAGGSSTGREAAMLRRPTPGPKRKCQASHERGSATVMALTWTSLLAVLAVVGLALIGLWSAYARAASAADLGALSGAGRVLESPDDACQAAGRVVRANHARLASCEVSGIEVLVVAAVPVPSGLARAALVGVAHEISASAHATITLVDT